MTVFPPEPPCIFCAAAVLMATVEFPTSGVAKLLCPVLLLLPVLNW